MKDHKGRVGSVSDPTVLAGGPSGRSDACDQERRSGYAHPLYSAALSEFGEPLQLRRSGAALLVRQIPGTDRRDAGNCYPLLACADWAGLAGDLDGLGDLVSVVAVIDPFAAARREDLEKAFCDLLRPFKEHFVVDLSLAAPSKHHLREARSALRAVSVDVVEPTADALEDWERLYSHLRERRTLTGVQAFSKSSFQKQLEVPGCVALRARVGGRCVAMSLWLVMGEVAYYHLAASDEEESASRESFESWVTRPCMHAMCRGRRRGSGGPWRCQAARYLAGSVVYSAWPYVTRSELISSTRRSSASWFAIGMRSTTMWPMRRGSA